MRRLGLVLLLVLLGTVGWWGWKRAHSATVSRPIPGEDDSGTVEVLNAAGRDGLARRVTSQLRGAGIDVVYFGTAPFDTLATTRILVRRGDSTLAVRVRELLGTGQVLREPDPFLLLDVSVYLGRDLAGTDDLGT